VNPSTDTLLSGILSFYTSSPPVYAHCAVYTVHFKNGLNAIRK